MSRTMHIPNGSVRLGAGLAIVVAALAWTGCDNTIEPLDESMGDQFAVQGYLDMGSDVQRVRVEGMRSSILGDRVDLSDVIVTTRDSFTGESVEWRRETVEGADGTPIDIYSAEFTPEAGRRYTMEIHRPGRSGTVAETVVPERPNVTVAEPVNLVQTVFLSDLPRSPTFMAVRYDVIEPEDNERRTVDVVYEQEGTSSTIRNRVDVRLAVDRFIVLGRLSRDDDDAPLTLAEIGLLVRLPSEEFERDVGSGNISNGEGFFGSIGRYEYTWTLAGDVVREIGFEDGQQGG